VEPNQLHVRCGRGESVWDAANRAFAPVRVRVVINGPGHPNPISPGQIGTVTVRNGESFSVVPFASATGAR